MLSVSPPCPGRLLLARPQCSQHTPSPGSQNSDCAVVTSSSAGLKRAAWASLSLPAPPPPSLTSPSVPHPSASSPRRVPGPRHLPRVHNPLRLQTSSAGHVRPDHIRKIPRAHTGLGRRPRRDLLYRFPHLSRRPSYPLRKPADKPRPRPSDCAGAGAAHLTASPPALPLALGPAHFPPVARGRGWFGAWRQPCSAVLGPGDRQRAGF